MTDVPDDPAADCRQRASATKRRETREAFVRAGFEMIEAEEPLVLSELCKRAGRSRGTFYSHIGSMSAFCVDLLVLRVVQRLGGATPETRVQVLDFLDALTAAYDEMMGAGVPLYYDRLTERVEQLIGTYRVPLPDVSPALRDAATLAMLLLSLLGNWAGSVDREVGRAILAQMYRD